MKRPTCEMKGTVPHPATKMLGWELNSGRVWKLSCDDHAAGFGGPGRWVSMLEGYDDGEAEAPKVQTKPAPAPTCKRCCQNDALPYPDGHGGQLCAACEDLQAREHVRWEQEQRALAAHASAEGRPRSINKRRGF